MQIRLIESDPVAQARPAFLDNRRFDRAIGDVFEKLTGET
jgi:hypothetical protein